MPLRAGPAEPEMAATPRTTIPNESGQENSTPAGPSESVVLPVLGMTCSACQRHVESALAASAGVRGVRVDLMRHRAWIEFDPRATRPQQLVETIRESGYDAVLPRAAESDTLASPESRNSPGWKAVVTIAAGVLAMALSMSPAGMSNSAQPLRWAMLTATTLLAIWAGGPIYRSARKALRHGETNMNTLVSLGTLVALLYSAYVTLWPRAMGEVYFDSVLLILGFLLLGKWLESRARHRAIAAVDALAQLQPATARIRRGETESMLPLGQVRLGDLAVILPGERIPVDGTIVSGRTTVDESMLTGESLPLERSQGDPVLAGSLNYDGAIVVQVEAVGAETTLRQIAKLVEQAQSSRAPMERLADRASAVFVPIVLALAVLTFAGWMLFAPSGLGWERAIASTVAVLVIACPCAMGLAVPAALTVAIGRGAQFGVLIKGGEALERLAGLQVVAMDKTGTLTVGKPALAAMTALPGYSEKELLRLAASAEDRSAHPLAAAIVSHARSLGISWSAADSVQVIPGRGLSAVVENRQLLLGNLELLREWSVPLSEATLLADPNPGVTRLWIALGDVSPQFMLAGFFDAKDTLRPTAGPAVAWLQNHGIQVRMLTGDSASAAQPIAEAVQIDQFAAGLLPADKVQHIRDWQRSGLRVAMVGDGINDAAALAQSDAGFAIGTGAALAQEAGDVLLMRSDPAGVCTAIALARSTVAVMRQNLAWAVGYNLIGIPLAAGLLYPVFHLALTPWMAAAAMAFSSLSVLLNSLRLRRWSPPSFAEPTAVPPA